MTYNQFAWYYDSLMEPSFYEDYFHYILKNASFHSVLELGCGTGTIAGLLSSQHKYVDGLDLSQDMIEICKERYPSLKKHFMVADMLDYSLNQTYDLVLCLCDSLNYVLGFENQVKVLENAYRSLNEEGTLIFDIHSPYKMNEIFSDYHEEEESDDFYFYWSVKKSGPYQITHYVVIEDLYENTRMEEKHIQESYPPAWYEEALKKIGFQKIIMDESLQPQMRIVFRAHKGGDNK